MCDILIQTGRMINVGKTNSDRLKQIETVSRVVRYLVLGLLVFSVGYSLLTMVYWSPTGFMQRPVRMTLNLLMVLVLWTWYWKLAELFHFYQRGMIFASETIRCVKALGWLCVINWLVTSAWRGTYYLSPETHAPLLPPGVQVTIHQSAFIMGFFSFSIRGFNIGMLLAGAIIVIIAWIMDEGRKIQEEQELTV